MEKYVGNWDQRKDVENDEKCDGMCEKCCHAGRGIIQVCFDIFQRLAQGCTISPNIFKVFINDMVVAVETAKQGVAMGEDTMSGLTFADDFVGISETPEGFAETDGEITRVH